MLEQRDLEQIGGLITESIKPLVVELQEVKSDVQDFKSEMQDFKSEMQDFKSEMQDFKSEQQREMKTLKKMQEDTNLNVRDIQLTLENDINTQIRIIAEGHTILNRKLDDALQRVSEVYGEREILKLQLVHLENEIAIVKKRLEELNSE